MWQAPKHLPLTVHSRPSSSNNDLSLTSDHKALGYPGSKSLLAEILGSTRGKSWYQFPHLLLFQDCKSRHREGWSLKWKSNSDYLEKTSACAPGKANKLLLCEGIKVLTSHSWPWKLRKRSQFWHHGEGSRGRYMALAVLQNQASDLRWFLGEGIQLRAYYDNSSLYSSLLVHQAPTWSLETSVFSVGSDSFLS